MAISKQNLIKISDYLWEIPKKFRSDMRVPARIYASEKMLDEIFKDKSLEQLVNLAALPGIVNYSLVMPDAHEGYGSPIGGVFATDPKNEGIISPGAVGYDINCGVRLLLSDLSGAEIKNRLDNLASRIQEEVPSGLGMGRKEKLSQSELDGYLENGAREAVRRGFGEEEDLKNCEAYGKLDWADAGEVSETAKRRGLGQIGTLGSGNHFLEIQKVEEIFDEEAARAFGFFPNQATVMIHTGSRGLGHQIATDYIRLMLSVTEKYKISLPDRELACAPFNSNEGQRYFRAMACGANFAWANRQMITHRVRQCWEEILGNRPLNVLYDVAHNIAKLEDGLVVHRKGATRAFPPDHPELAEKYRAMGQPVLIPGSMGTSSFVLRGTREADQSFYSACHGAGRTMSRHQAVKSFSGKNIVKDLESKGIIIKCYSYRGIVEEAPLAYKDVEEVVEVVHQAGLAKRVAKLIPIAVIKGE